MDRFSENFQTHFMKSIQCELIYCMRTDRRTGGQTDMSNLIVFFFLIFANAPKTVRIQDNYITYSLVEWSYTPKHVLHSWRRFCMQNGQLLPKPLPLLTLIMVCLHLFIQRVYFCIHSFLYFCHLFLPYIFHSNPKLISNFRFISTVH